MTNLETTNFGNLRSATAVSTSEQISRHISSIVDANEVELGKYSVAKSYGIALGLSAVAGLNQHNTGHGIAIGEETFASNYGIALGIKAKGDQAVAIGPDAEAYENSLALGRYAKLSSTA